MGRLWKNQRIVSPVKILHQVVVAVNSYPPPGSERPWRSSTEGLCAWMQNVLVLQPWILISRVWLLRAIYVAPPRVDMFVILVPVIVRPFLIILTCM